MPYWFVEDEEKIKQEPLIFKPINRTIKHKFETEIYRRAMIDILFENYKYISEGLIVFKPVKKLYNKKVNPFILSCSTNILNKKNTHLISKYTVWEYALPDVRKSIMKFLA